MSHRRVFEGVILSNFGRSQTNWKSLVILLPSCWQRICHPCEPQPHPGPEEWRTTTRKRATLLVLSARAQSWGWNRLVCHPKLDFKHVKLDLNLINLILNSHSQSHSKCLQNQVADMNFEISPLFGGYGYWHCHGSTTLNSESEVDRYDKPYEITQLVTCQVKHAAFIKSSIDVSPSGLKMPWEKMLSYGWKKDKSRVRCICIRDGWRCPHFVRSCCFEVEQFERDPFITFRNMKKWFIFYR